MENSRSHIQVLKCFDELRFNLGRNSLCDFLKGNVTDTIEKNNLTELDSYGSLFNLSREEIDFLIEELLENKFLAFEQIKHFKVIVRTAKGVKEIYEKKFVPKEFSNRNSPTLKYSISETPVEEIEKKLISNFEFFFSLESSKKYTFEQKRAIVSSHKHILTIAGAGSGKTSVLVKRVEFLIKFRQVKTSEILAITFTRKAKEEMQKRLESLQIVGVQVETFNSFCEKVLLKKQEKIYSGNEDVRVASFRNKIQIVANAFEDLAITIDDIAEEYFNKRQLREKSKDELFFSFVNDVFSIIDSYKNRKLEVEKFYELAEVRSKKIVAEKIYKVCVYAQKKLRELNLRDFSDQINETNKFFEKNSLEIPKFKHVLIDEYQDINLPQFELIKFLSPENLFVVGDPRQAIYGWRGSDISYILDFPTDFEKTQVIILKENFRSTKEIIEFSNMVIRPMNLPEMVFPLLSGMEEKGVFVFEKKTEELEKIFVCECIKNSKCKREEIFILARTNRQLDAMRDYLAMQNIEYNIKSEEREKENELKAGKVVLATIHAIKGMEAEEVYLVGASSLFFPNRVTDNFVFELVKDGEDYDKEAEELRLFYVALTRAKKKLVVTYTGNLSKFVSLEMLKFIGKSEDKKKGVLDFEGLKVLEKTNTLNVGNASYNLIKNLLKDWRSEKANSYGLPTYMILSNDAIDEVAKNMPRTKMELLNCKGFGDVKIAKYGDEILRIVNGGN